MNRILSNALEWGVKILYVNGELPWYFFFSIQYFGCLNVCVLCTFLIICVNADVIAYVQKKKQSILSQCRDTAAVKTKVSFKHI